MRCWNKVFNCLFILFFPPFSQLFSYIFCTFYFPKPVFQSPLFAHSGGWILNTPTCIHVSLKVVKFKYIPSKSVSVSQIPWKNTDMIMMVYGLSISQRKPPWCCYGCSQWLHYLQSVEQLQDFRLWVTSPLQPVYALLVSITHRQYVKGYFRVDFPFNVWSYGSSWMFVEVNNGHTDVWRHKCKHYRRTHTHTERSVPPATAWIWLIFSLKSNWQ